MSQHFTTILLASNTIQYLALRQSQITESLRPIELTDSVISDIIKRDDAFFREIMTELIHIANKVGDYMNSHDSVDETDEQVVNGAMKTINANSFIHGIFPDQQVETAASGSLPCPPNCSKEEN